jgi:hypothetical protein
VRTSYEGTDTGSVEVHLGKQDSVASMSSIQVASLPEATVRVNLPADPEVAGTWIARQVAVNAPDGRRATWAGPPAQLEVRYEGIESEPLTVLSLRFEPSVAAPGDTVQVIIEIEGDQPAEESGTISGLAVCRLTADRTETVQLRRPSASSQFSGRLHIPETLTSGTVVVEGIDLGAFAGPPVRVQRAEQPELFRGAELVVR